MLVLIARTGRPAPATLEAQLGHMFSPGFGLYVDGLDGVGDDGPYGDPDHDGLISVVNGILVIPLGLWLRDSPPSPTQANQRTRAAHEDGQPTIPRESFHF